MIEALLDGVPAGGQMVSWSVADGALLRGDGCFETIRSYRGEPFMLGPHLERLQRSAAALRLRVPEEKLLSAWVRRLAASGDCAVRVVCSRGAVIPGSEAVGRCLVVSHPLPAPGADLRLRPVAAPWHPAGRNWELAGVKSLSYAPNQAASRLAQEAGFDDALLVSSGGGKGLLLEGPTFSVGWVVGGRLELPSLRLGILDSITRRVVVELADRDGIEVVVGRFPLSRLDRAEEVVAMSTMKEVRGVVAVGERDYAVGPVTEGLAAAYRGVVAAALPSRS